MKSFLQRKAALFTLFFLALVALGMNFVPDEEINDALPIRPNSVDRYDEFLFEKIQSVDDLLKEAQLQIDENDELVGGARDLATLEKVIMLVRYRFYHGYCYYNYHQNWIAVLMGKYIRHDLSAIVIPDDILKYRLAACSQSSIVIIKALRKMKIPYRQIGLKGHFALEANVDKRWYFIDANLEPDFNEIGGRKSLSEILKKNEQFALYGKSIDSAEIASIFSEVSFSPPNQKPAPNALLFQRTTKILSHWLWLVPGLLCLYGYSQRIRRQDESARIGAATEEIYES